MEGCTRHTIELFYNSVRMFVYQFNCSEPWQLKLRRPEIRTVEGFKRHAIKLFYNLVGMSVYPFNYSETWLEI